MRETLMNANASETTKIKTHFAKIIVEGTAKHPYYGIMFFNPADGEYHVGYGSYYIGNVFQWFAEEFEIVDKDTNVLTNEDRIRAMSDEELAKWIDNMYCQCVWCDVKKIDCNNTECTECIANWLKQPAEDKHGRN